MIYTCSHTDDDITCIRSRVYVPFDYISNISEYISEMIRVRARVQLGRGLHTVRANLTAYEVRTDAALSRSRSRSLSLSLSLPSSLLFSPLLRVLAERRGEGRA